MRSIRRRAISQVTQTSHRWGSVPALANSTGVKVGQRLAVSDRRHADEKKAGRKLRRTEAELYPFWYEGFS